MALRRVGSVFAHHYWYHGWSMTVKDRVVQVLIEVLYSNSKHRVLAKLWLGLFEIEKGCGNFLEKTFAREVILMLSGRSKG